MRDLIGQLNFPAQKWPWLFVWECHGYGAILYRLTLYGRLWSLQIVVSPPWKNQPRSKSEERPQNPSLWRGGTRFGGGYFVVSPYVIPNLIRSALEPPNRGLSTLKKSASIEIGGETTKPQPNSIRSALEPPNRGRTTLKKISHDWNPKCAHKIPGFGGGSTLWRGGFVGALEISTMA